MSAVGPKRTWGVSFKVLDDPSIDTTSRTGKLVMGILALIAEFENDIRRERQMDGIAKAKDRGVKFGRKRVMRWATTMNAKTNPVTWGYLEGFTQLF
jgi:DNA invertase Pin-like site-specific DNA recombinase